MLVAHSWFGLPTTLLLGLGGGGAAVALAGWLDDRSPVSPLLKGVVHFSSAAWAVYWLGGLEELSFANQSIWLGPAGFLLAVFALFWSTNLFNFMDGIDGLAAAEAITVGSIAGVLLFRDGQTALGIVATLISASTSGFLVWNWAPAKIFMGDVGSGFLGFIFGGLALASEASGSLAAVWWVVLASVFIVDATFTLFKRAMRREVIYSAHRTHAYQRAVQAGLSHSAVTSIVILFNVVLGVLVVLGSTSDSRWWYSVAGVIASIGLYAAAGQIRTRPRADSRDCASPPNAGE
jgi:Fuc2NAc and GlcNAc transferase